MFSLQREIGCHKVFSFEEKMLPFKEYLEELFNTKDLTQIHTQSEDYKAFLEGKFSSLENVETDLQKIFYKDIKTKNTFKKLYCSLVQEIYKQFFPNEPFLIYQSFPSIRFQFMNNIAVPPHADSDDLGRHPKGEKNFIIPITDMKGTTRLFLESEPNKKDFQGIDLQYGNLFYFNGNTCVHYNQSNQEGYTRISFDFRVITKEDYLNYILYSSITKTNPRDLYKERESTKMIVGGYYQCMFKDESLDECMNWKFNKEFIFQTRPVFDEKEAIASGNYFRNGDPFLTEFRETETLEKMIKEFISVKHCYMTTSGSTAILVALLACDIKAGDDVLVPDYTMIATANAVRLLGANPILCDVDKETYTLSLETIQKKRTPNTKAVLHVSLNNRTTGIEEIVKYCKESGIYLIEDAAQSLGAKVNGTHFGTFGDIGCFSLSSPKIITTGQGGFVITNSSSLAEKIFKIKNFGRRSGGIEEYDIFGLNFKFTDIQAVIGQEQMKKLPNRIERMKEIYSLYSEGLRGIEDVQLLGFQDSDWIPWFVDILVSNREELITFLKKHDVQTRITYPAIHATDVYKTSKYEDTEFENTNFISQSGLFLPTHFLLTDKQIEYICTLIRMFYS
jgi:perosamine synthetase